MISPRRHRSPRSRVPPLSQETFDKFRALIYQKTGIHMREGKQILVVQPAAQAPDAAEAGHLRGILRPAHLAATNDPEEMPHFIDAVSTNETYFFREGNHFTALARHDPAGAFRAHGRVRIWSAGCSTGEEVYTLRIVADQAAHAAGRARCPRSSAPTSAPR